MYIYIYTHTWNTYVSVWYLTVFGNSSEAVLSTNQCTEDSMSTAFIYRPAGYHSHHNNKTHDKHCKDTITDVHMNEKNKIIKNKKNSKNKNKKYNKNKNTQDPSTPLSLSHICTLPAAADTIDKHYLLTNHKTDLSSVLKLTELIILE